MTVPTQSGHSNYIEWRMIRVVAIAVVSLLSLSTLANASDSREKAFAEMGKVDRFASEAPMFITSYSLTALRKLGHLNNEVAETMPNPHLARETIELRTLSFDGLEIFGDLRNSNILRPIKITIESSHWKILYGLGIGSTTSQIIEALGKPTKESEDLLKYSGETETVDFFTHNQVTTKIIFYYYSD